MPTRSLLYLCALGLLLALNACRIQDPTAMLSIDAKYSSQPLEARSTGDTLRIPFATSAPTAQIQVAERANWLETELRADTLLLYVARNATTSTRQTELLLQVVDKGERLSQQRLTLRQASSETLAADRYIFPYFPVFDYPLITYYENRADVYTLLAPAAGGQVTEPLLLRSSFDAHTLRQSFDWQGGAEGWIHGLSFTQTDEGWGISYQADALPSGTAQRKALLRLSDPEHPDLSIAFTILQLASSVSLAQPADVLRELPQGNQPLSIALHSELPLEELHLTTYVYTLPYRDALRDLASSRERQQRLLSSPAWQYSIKPEKNGMERPELQQYFQLERSASGLMLKGRPTSNVGLLQNSLDYSEVAYYAFCITNERNDQKLWIFRRVPFLGMANYLSSTAGRQEETLQLSSESGSLELALKLNVKASDLRWSYPNEVSFPDNNWETNLPEGATLSYPDELRIPGVRYRANATRHTRRFRITAHYEGTSFDSSLSGVKLTAPLSFVCVQAPFTGSYSFGTDEATTLDFAAEPEAFYEKYVISTVALTTNLSPELIRIERSSTDRSGWLSYQLKTDPETGLVVSIAFYAAKNSSGGGRSTTLKLLPPDGEGLQPITFTLRQAAAE